MMRFSAMLLLAVVAAGCANNNSKTEVRELRVDKDAAMIEIIAAFGDEGVPFPEGSVVERDKDGTFYVRLPKGYTYLLSYSEGDDAVLRESEVIGVRCTCTEGNGCDPVTYNGGFYCVMKSGCTLCNRELIWKDNLGGQNKGAKADVVILGMINRNAGITLLCEKELPESEDDIDEIAVNQLIRGKYVIHGNAFPELFDVEDIVETLRDKYGFIAEKGLEPNAMAYLNVYGNVVLVPFWFENGFVLYESGDAKYEAMAISKDKPSNFVCICESGSGSKGGCELQEIHVPFVGTGYRCKSDGCAVCALVSQQQ